MLQGRLKAVYSHETLFGYYTFTMRQGHRDYTFTIRQGRNDYTFTMHQGRKLIMICSIISLPISV